MLETRKNLMTEDQRKVFESQEKKQKQKERKLIADMNACFGTAEGMNTLRWIMDQCGFLKPSTVYSKDTWEVQDKAMVHNEARRYLYLQIRKNLSPAITQPVENQGLAMDEPEVDIFS